MKIKKIQFTNFRKFENLSIDFNESNMNIIIGVNGSGKSTILDGVELLISNFSSPYSDDKHYFVYEYYKNHIKLGKGEADLRMDWEDLNKNYSFSYSLSPLRKEHDYNQIYSSFKRRIERGNLPIFRFFKDFRKFEFNQKELGATEAMFSESIEMIALIEWYLEIINLENQEKINNNNTNYELALASNVRNIFNSFLKKIDSNINEVLITKSSFSNKRNLFIRKKNELLEFDYLSSGEKNVIGILLEILFRSSTTNINNSNLSNTEGIVLIDEVELHLHPRLQSTFLKALQSVFPKIQFIVTTHSPNTINQFSIDDIIVLNDEGVQTKELIETYGKDVNTILEEIMGSTSRPSDIQKQFDDIRNLIEESNNIDAINEKLSELRNTLGGLDTELTELETLLAFKELNEIHSERD